MKTKYKQFEKWIKKQIKAITPGNNAIEGASLGLLTITAFFWLLYSFKSAFILTDYWLLVLFLVFTLLALLFGFLARWAVKMLHSIPHSFKLALLISFPLLFLISFEWMEPIAIFILASLCGAAILVFKKTGFKNLSKPKKVVSILGAIIGFGGFIAIGVLFAQNGFEMDPIANAALDSKENSNQIIAISPSEKGAYNVNTLFYGSGKDLHRPEFGSKVDIKTDSVNGLAFIDNWNGFGGWWREKYWGFDSKSLPINGRVWYPEGKGPFPLALIVHGNHGMQDYSDTGYEYLGNLLASKGIILASVDQNFINGSWSDIFGGLEKENDARGWLLLEHLKVWHQWNNTNDNPFYKKIDTTNLALIGHSRGGEAVAHAALFNKLPNYPDDASIKFNYNYNIKGIVAIAPVDGQYEPSRSRTEISNLNYLAIHGSQDADVQSFMGSQQYERVKFNDSLYHFKAGLYVYGANHGQFNTSWGNNDTGNPFSGFLNLKQLISAEDQIKIAKVYISAFLELTLQDKNEYLPLFLDARKGKHWLPETIYLNQFEDSNLKILANFDEDFNVTSTTHKNGIISTKNLSVWREQEIRLKWQKKGSKALYAGWHYDLDKEKEATETIPDSLVASYTIGFPEKTLDSTSVLTFSMAESKESSNPKSKGKWVDENEQKESEQNEKNNTLENQKTENKEENKKGEKDDKDEQDEKEPKKPINFTIQLSDAQGQKASLELSEFLPLQRAIDVIILKTGFLMGDKRSEMVFQTFYFPIIQFKNANPNLNTNAIEKMEFIFNKTKNGVIAIDNIGIMKAIN